MSDAMGKGYVSIHREIMNHWVWQEKPFSKGQAWVDLILLANYKPEKFPFKGQVVEGKRGTVYRSISWLADRWGWGRDKTRRFLELLQDDGMITLEATKHQTTISLINYERFQNMTATSQTTNRQQARNQTATRRQQSDIYNKDNKGNKENKGDSLLDTMEAAIKQYGCRVLVVDNLMTAMVDDLSLDQYRQQTIFVNNLAKMAKRHNVVIFLIAHPRKKQGFGSFDNDDVSGSANITNLVDVVIRYSRPKGKDIPPDTMDRELTVFKNRLTGVTNRTGIKLFFQQESKRIAESTFAFDWELGWEEHYEQMEFVSVPDGEKLPFD